MLNAQALRALMNSDGRIEEQRRMENMISQLKRESLARKHFENSQINQEPKESKWSLLKRSR